MLDSFYPSIDPEFLEQQILESGKVIPESKLKVGKTTSFVLDSNKAMHRRIIIFREVNGQINYDQATAIAVRLSFVTNLMTWLEDNRGWKEGAQIVSQKEIG